MDDFITDELREMVKGLIGLYDLAYQEAKRDIEYVILNDIKDEYIIEHLFDRLLNIPTDNGYQLLVDFCDYVSTFNKELVDDYIGAYEDLYGDEEKTTKKI